MDDIDDGEADDLRVFAVLKDDEREYEEYWEFKANGVSGRETAYTEDEYRGPTGNA